MKQLVVSERILIAFIFILSGEIIYSQTSLSGLILDKRTREPLPGATVYLPDLKAGDISDKDGHYKVSNLPTTSLLVQVSFLGYRSITERVDLTKVSTVNFEIEEAITEINEVNIIGVSHLTEMSRNPVPTIAVTTTELHRTLNTNIIDAIANLPGVNAVTTGPNVSKPFIHGLGYNRVLTLFDGIRLEGQQWGDEHGIEVDENAVVSIEIVKGPASLVYGPDALAGVVNLLPASAFHNDTIQGAIQAEYQSNNGLFNTTASLNGNKKGFIWGGVISDKRATNYRNRYDGRVYGTAFREFDVRSFIGLNKPWGYSRLSFSLFNDQQEIPDGSRDSSSRKFTKRITEEDSFRPVVPGSELNSYKITPLHQHIQHYLIYSSNNIIIGNKKLGSTLGFQRSIRREFSHPEAPGIEGLYLDLKTFTYDLKFIFAESAGWETTLGLNGMVQANTNKGTDFTIPDYNQADVGPFLLLTKTISKFDLSAGVRYDTRFFRNDPMYVRTDPLTGFNSQVSPPDTVSAEKLFNASKQTFSGISANLGATYNITRKLLVKFNVARGLRTPNVLELSANGAHPGTLIYQIGNSSFKPEFSMQEDIGLTFHSDHVSADIDLYNNNISNYIFNQKLSNHLGSDSIITEHYQTFKFAQTRARLYGLEANLDIHPYDWLHFQNSISVLNGVNKGGKDIIVSDSSRYLPMIPPLHTNTEVQVSFKKIMKHFGSSYIKTSLDYYAAQNKIYSAYGTETSTPGYMLVNAGLGTDILNSKRRVVMILNFSVNNIFDVAYQSHLSRLKYFEYYPVNISGRSGIYNMGRNISFKVTFPLDFR